MTKKEMIETIESKARIACSIAERNRVDYKEMTKDSKYTTKQLEGAHSLYESSLTRACVLISLCDELGIDL